MRLCHFDVAETTFTCLNNTYSVSVYTKYIFTYGSFEKFSMLSFHILINSVTLSLSFYKSQLSKLAGRSSASFHLTTTIVKLVIIILGLQGCRVIQYITHYTHACCGFCTQRILRLLWQLMLYVKTAHTRCKDGLYMYTLYTQ